MAPTLDWDCSSERQGAREIESKKRCRQSPMDKDAGIHPTVIYSRNKFVPQIMNKLCWCTSKYPMNNSMAGYSCDICDCECDGMWSNPLFITHIGVHYCSNAFPSLYNSIIVLLYSVIVLLYSVIVLLYSIIVLLYSVIVLLYSIIVLMV